MPREPKLSYLKCHRCRWDRQKCLPLSRVWPQRCDRCEKYNYRCSESRLKSEKRTNSPPAEHTVSLPTNPQAALEDKGVVPVKDFQECIQDISSWIIVNDYVAKLYPEYFKQYSEHGMKFLIFFRDESYRYHIFHDFLAEKSSIIRHTRSMAKSFQTRGRYSEAAILIERIQNMFAESDSLFSNWKGNPDLIEAQISLHEALNDHASAQILQERLIGLTSGEERKVATSKLWQLYRTSSESVLASISRRLQNNCLPHAEKLEHFLRMSGPDNMMPLIHRALLTANNDLVLEAVRGPDWRGAEDLLQSSALHCAIRMNFVEGARTLLNAEAHLDARDWDSQTPLHIATLRGFKELVEMLLGAKADIHAKTTFLGETSFHIAAREGHGDIVEVLLEAKADVHAINVIGDTPLHIAAFQGFNEIVEMLSRANADVNRSSRDGETSLHIAARRGHGDIIETLVLAKANVNQESNLRETPLHLAARASHVPLLRILLEAGADMEKTDYCGQTPLAVAVYHGQKDAATYLIQRGGIPWRN